MSKLKPDDGDEKSNYSEAGIANTTANRSTDFMSTTQQSSVNPTDDDPRQLIPKLCNHFYHLGWASGKFSDMKFELEPR